MVAYAEMLAHALGQVEGCRISAHLLVPGFTYTGMISRFLPEKPDAAWTPEQVADFLLEASGPPGTFTSSAPTTMSRPSSTGPAFSGMPTISSGGRPALSRWHPDFAEDFEAFISDYLGKN